MMAERRAFCRAFLQKTQQTIFIFYFFPPVIKGKAVKVVFKHFSFLLVLITVTNASSDLAEFCGSSRARIPGILPR